MSAAPGPWAAAATAAVFLLGDFFFASGGMAAGEVPPFHIINFNFETVQVTWNASKHTGANFTFRYRHISRILLPGNTTCYATLAKSISGSHFRISGYQVRPFETDFFCDRLIHLAVHPGRFRGDNYSQCPSYILQHRLTVGCVLQAKGDSVMDFSIGNGTHLVLSHSTWISDFLKPGSPRDLRFHWHKEALTVTCSDLPYRGLRYEVQHNSIFDEQWQSTEEDTCNVTIKALDAARCYSFRARVTAKESSYGPHTYPSDWSEVAHRQRGEPRDSCQKTPLSSKFIVVYGMVAILIIFLLPLTLWKLHRVKKLLVPRVPDPKVTFPGLFESHHGNFQEWIKDTQNIAVLSKVEDGDQESILAEPLLVQLPPTKAETPAATVTDLSHPQTVQTAGDPDPLLRPPAPGKEQVSLGGFTFVVDDNAYVTL